MSKRRKRRRFFSRDTDDAPSEHPLEAFAREAVVSNALFSLSKIFVWMCMKNVFKSKHSHISTKFLDRKNKTINKQIIPPPTHTACLSVPDAGTYVTRSSFFSRRFFSFYSHLSLTMTSSETHATGRKSKRHPLISLVWHAEQFITVRMSVG